MQATKETFKAVAGEAYDILDRYIVIHNEVFRTSIRNVIPIPGLFKPIDYGSYDEELFTLQDELQKVGSVISEFSVSSAARSSEREFLSVLTGYVRALERAVTQLWAICSRLDGKSRGDRKYGWGEFRRDKEIYDLAVSVYRSVGEKLNAAYRNL